MKYEWTDWEEVNGDRDPYIHWSEKGPGEVRIVNQDDARDGDNILLTNVRSGLGSEDWNVIKNLDQIVVPKAALNENAPGNHEPRLPERSKLPLGIDGEHSTAIRQDTIIAGVVDVGMPLGHKRLRFPNGKTRLLSAWQMIGNWSLKKQEDIPFGCEFYEADINKKILECSANDLTGKLDEDAFHKSLGVLNFDQIARQTAIANRASHGAHVLDMVAGSEFDEPHDFAERVRVIAVNAPSSAVFGASGTYLDSYMLHAIQRITDLADGIWRNVFEGQLNQNPKGFPIVINLSFGKNSGSKDTLDRFAAALKQFLDKRESKGWSRIDIVMPTGNDNLARCNAYALPELGEPKSLNWRMQPQDQSSNYAEAWFEDGDESQEARPPDIRLSLSAPNGSSVLPTYPALKARKTFFTWLKRDSAVVAGLYLTRVAEEIQTNSEGDERTNPTQQKFRYVCCVAPTFRTDGQPSVASSGLWQIIMENTLAELKLVNLSVQTDQSLSPNRSINRRSYFDDSGYETHGPDGRVLESYSYPKNKDGLFINLDKLADTPVRRHGTINASAAHKAVARVGGYRSSDGRPAFYSSTGRGRRDGSDSGYPATIDGKNTSRAPTAALPTDDGPAHGGILSAGSADGSRVLMRGTSFAASQASRLMISELLQGRGGTSVRKTLSGVAILAEQRVAKSGPEELTANDEIAEVIGRGRISAQRQRKLRRVISSPFDV